ncbi:HAD family hydrolase [Nocardiopsis sp. YSL2]|uniref:HAD family hydrolase n=1 Tax=Nocardiopsis sp. YSL2 TaxID=2939492 RepID=UPI0026F4671F|nr:HAD family hydrolase [Nocardiopsis sp. YSL2]
MTGEPLDTAVSALRHRPEALLLDFGGVVFQTRKRPEGRADVARHLETVLARAGHTVGADTLLVSLNAGLAALKDWKNAAGRRLTPVELDHRTIWTDFLASDLDAPVREVLAGSASELLARMSTLLSEHEVRPGVRELLATADELGVRVGMVSNAHSGRSHRTLLREAGLEDHFGVQVYSDEVGIRKPHPEMIALAARALGTDPERCWYVGDTQDRDVVAGRRAGVAAVLLTRHHHTDTPPYPVRVRADAVYDTPEGLVAPLRESLPAVGAVPAEQAGAPEPDGQEGATGGARPRAAGSGPRAVRTIGSEAPRLPAALLLDQGGVIADSTPTPDAQRAFAERLAARLRRAGHELTPDTVLEAVLTGRDRYRAWKGEHPEDAAVPETSPRRFWCEFVGRDLSPRVRDFLYAESAQLMVEYARAKSHARMRRGVPEVLRFCEDNAIPVAIVSNTVCGRAVREELDRFGVDHLVGAHVYSDELGRRKPDPATVASALTALDADPAHSWFVGDKPWRDTAAAHRGGIGTTVIVRGGSASDERVDAALTGVEHERPTHVIDEMDDLLELWVPVGLPQHS